ncbi:hypothetical protein Zmor_019267 [Zophobas morio]|uniref:Uncharacterized protein n=1 Tax=Zophobas morio TaxID=2755281 RepID=A0AA38I1D5_9CUCU|nr:hypothetical protein Zmor_019267 [Zophobas morio]
MRFVILANNLHSSIITTDGTHKKYTMLIEFSIKSSEEFINIGDEIELGGGPACALAEQDRQPTIINEVTYIAPTRQLLPAQSQEYRLRLCSHDNFAKLRKRTLFV